MTYTLRCISDPALTAENFSLVPDSAEPYTYNTSWELTADGQKIQFGICRNINSALDGEEDINWSDLNRLPCLVVETFMQNAALARDPAAVPPEQYEQFMAMKDRILKKAADKRQPVQALQDFVCAA